MCWVVIKSLIGTFIEVACGGGTGGGRSYLFWVRITAPRSAGLVGVARGPPRTNSSMFGHDREHPGIREQMSA